MKKCMFIIALFTGLLSMAQQKVLYSWYDDTTKDFMYSQFDTIVPQCVNMVWKGNSVTACATTALVTADWAKPRFNPDTHVFYNAATTQEQENYLADQEAASVSPTAQAATNYVLTTPQSNEQLNNRYAMQGEGFILYCKNIPLNDGSTGYIKGKNGDWGKIYISSN